MASTPDEVMDEDDVTEGTRVMDGNILRSEVFTSATLSTKLTVTYDDLGKVVSRVTEDI